MSASRIGLGSPINNNGLHTNSVPIQNFDVESLGQRQQPRSISARKVLGHTATALSASASTTFGFLAANSSDPLQKGCYGFASGALGLLTMSNIAIHSKTE